MPEQGNVRRNSGGGCGKVAKDQRHPVLKDRKSKLSQKRSETGPRRKVSLSKRYQDVCEAARPPPPEGTPRQQTATWPGPPADPS